MASTVEPDEILGFAQKLQAKAAASGMFAFPPQIDTKIDQPQTEIVVDREKVAELGLNLQQVGQDLGAAVGGNFVNRFSIGGGRPQDGAPDPSPRGPRAPPPPGTLP